MAIDKYTKKQAKENDQNRKRKKKQKNKANKLRVGLVPFFRIKNSEINSE